MRPSKWDWMDRAPASAPDDPEARRPETRQFEQLLARVLVEEAGALLTVAALVDTVDPFRRGAPIPRCL